MVKWIVFLVSIVDGIKLEKVAPVGGRIRDSSNGARKIKSPQARQERCREGKTRFRFFNIRLLK
ncbi:hypothetical protein [Cohnella cellulosilytica]|uniref:hypothetical protein n=1 Tax=Cohnella cellulosilytica TaxID=986710 RepID=UPI00366FAFEF